MIHSEGFLDSALLRSSLFSKAKELNYLPRSIKSSTAKVLVEFEATGQSQPYVIRKGETFTTLVKQESYSFSVAEDIVVTSPNNSFSFTTSIFEGIYNSDSYVYGTQDKNQFFKIQNKDVDISSLVVLVYEDNVLIPQKYIRATTLLGLTENSKIFFVQPSIDGFYEVVFGDGVMGKQPKKGSSIILDYRVSVGPDANGSKVFTSNFDPTGSGELLSTVNVKVLPFFSNNQTQAYSIDGELAESEQSIKYYAPRHFQVQERAVTVSDYEILLKTQFPEIGAVTVFGGEDLSPPRYGKVFVAVDIKNVEGFPDIKKREYFTFLKSRSPLSINPEFINPEFTYIKVDTKIKYNVNITTKSVSNIKASVVTFISEFAENNLNSFKSNLRYSKFVKEIDNIDPSIISNSTNISLYKKIPLKISETQNVELSFKTALKDPFYYFGKTTPTFNSTAEETHTLFSTTFVLSGEKCRLEDDGDGIIRIVKISNDKHVYVKDVGTVNYETGHIKLQNFYVDGIDDNVFKIFVKTKDKDIEGSKNEIISIEPEEISIEIEVSRE
jgi:hypothetical protein